MFSWKEFWKTFFGTLGGVAVVLLTIGGAVLMVYLLGYYPVATIVITAIVGLLAPAIHAGFTE